MSVPVVYGLYKRSSQEGYYVVLGQKECMVEVVNVRKNKEEKIGPEVFLLKDFKEEFTLVPL